MKVAITGINGFIGGSLFKELKAKYNCVGMSTKPINKAVVFLKDGIPEENISDVDVLIHCGGILSGSYTADDYYYSNVLCTRNIVSWAHKNKVKHVILLSSGAVYGEHAECRSENDSVCPDSLYAFSKWSAEKEIEYSPILVKTVLRLYFPIGNISYNHLFSRLANRALKGETIYLNCKGRPLISPISINDVVECIESIIDNQVYGVFNLCSSEVMSIGDIASIIISKCGSNSNMIYSNREVLNYIGDSNKLSRFIGKKDFFSIDDSINLMLKKALKG